MHPRPRSARILPLLAIGAALLLLPGCSTNSDPIIGIGGDTGGKHLVAYATDRGVTAGQTRIVLYDLDAVAFRPLRNITFTTKPELNPNISTDGLLIAFQCDTAGNGNDDIYLYARSRAALVAVPKLNTDSSETEPAFTGDIQRMLFVRKWSGHRHIRIYDPVIDSVLAPAGLDTSAAYDDWAPSPDRTGTRFAFVSDRNGNPDIFVYDAGAVLDIPDLRSAGIDIEPSLTPDGLTLVFASDRAGGSGNYDLYLYNLDSAHRGFLTIGATVNTSANERHPAIGAGATVISFQSDRATGLGLWDVWNYNRDSGAVGQGAGQSSVADDVAPSLFWP